jgi:threonine dehydrogenase-like Zn-dependent dehydrogenase
LAGAGRIFAIDSEPSRLDMARAQGAEVINFDEEDPVETLMRLTCNIGVDRAIDAVGVDAEHAHSGPAAKKAKKLKTDFAQERHEIVKKPHPDGDNWQPGDAPSQALNWAIEGLAKAGTLSIVGVYPDSDRFFPIGKAMRKNLTIRMGNCNHRKYIPKLIELVRSKMIDPSEILTQEEPLDDAIEAYKAFDLRKSNWVKVALHPKPE